MSKSSFKTISLMLLSGFIAMSACGCGEQKPAAPSSTTVPPVVTPQGDSTTQTASSEEKPQSVERTRQPALIATETVGENSEKTPMPDRSVTGESTRKASRLDTPAKPATKPRKNEIPLGEAAFFADDIVGLFVAHPKQFLNSPVGQFLLEFVHIPGNGRIPELNLGFDEIERVTLVLDQDAIDRLASQAGLSVAANEVAGVNNGDGGGIMNPQQLKNTLKQFGLAFHNYHDVFSRFPRADGNGTGEQTGLSWRVHLLPFLDLAALYNQFHMNEEWDSDHNKTLIAQMPAIFKSPGVTDNEKTSFHVFVGENTLFNADVGPGMREITDGTSNTILAVLAGADTAEIWTKPGGLEVDLKSPKKALGEIKGDEFIALFVDGSVHTLSTKIDDTMLANLIQPADGNAVDIGGPQETGASGMPSFPWPTLIVSVVNDAKQAEIVKTLLNDAAEETYAGQSFQKNQLNAVWFPDSRTVVAGTVKSVKQSISAKQSGKSSISKLIDRLQLKADFSSAVDLESQADLFGQVAQFNPIMGMISNLETLTIEASVSAKEGDPLLEVNAIASDAEIAAQLTGLASGFLSMGKQNLEQMPEARSDGEKEIQDFFKVLANSANITNDGDQIQFRVPIPSDVDRILELLKPAMLEAKAAAKAAQESMGIRQIGLAFHNFHDAFGAFPGAGRIHRDKPVGLSWRVYLLPYLDQAPLYNQFNFDEPWDSDHNKALIEKMPAIFQSPGVDDVGKTTFHVFTGAGAPFADDQTPKIRDFTDGTSNSILMVVSGPETAEIWTKPGGLDFDAENPLKALGKLVGEMFLVLMADGSFRQIDKNIPAESFLQMIRHNDGKAGN